MDGREREQEREQEQEQEQERVQDGPREPRERYKGEWNRETRTTGHITVEVHPSTVMCH